MSLSFFADSLVFRGVPYIVQITLSFSWRGRAHFLLSVIYELKTK